MGADESAENTPKFTIPNCLPKPKSLAFRWKKASLGVRSRAQQENFAGFRCDIAIYLFCPYLTFKETYTNAQSIIYLKFI